MAKNNNFGMIIVGRKRFFVYFVLLLQCVLIPLLHYALVAGGTRKYENNCQTISPATTVNLINLTSFHWDLSEGNKSSAFFSSVPSELLSRKLPEINGTIGKKKKKKTNMIYMP